MVKKRFLNLLLNSKGLAKNNMNIKSTKLLNMNRVLILIIFLGIIFRFINLDNKVFWLDETFTSLQVSGYLQKEVKAKIANGSIIDITEINEYQYPTKNSSKSSLDTIKGIISFEPQHTPLYFVLCRYWHQIFGNSVFVIRMLSVLTGIACLPIIYFICIDLFESKIVGLFASALLSISPFFVVLSQEARPYSLWTLTILLSCFSLIRLKRKPSLINCFTYTASLTISLYTFLFTVLVWMAHLGFIFLSDKKRFSQYSVHFLGSSLIAYIFFLPWIITLIEFRDRLNNYASKPASLPDFLQAGFMNFGRLFFDLGVTSQSPKPFIFLSAIAILLCCLIYSYLWIYFLKKNNNTISILFINSLFILPISIVLAVDIFKGSQYFVVSRYLIPCWIAMVMAIAFALASLTEKKSSLKAVGIVLASVLLGFSLLSDIYFVKSDKWWTKSFSNYNLDVASIINESPKPLVVSDDFYLRVISLSYNLRRDTKYQIMVEPIDPLWQPIKIETNQSENIFLYNPSSKLTDQLVNQGEIVPLFNDDDSKTSLFKFTPKSP